MEREMGRVPRGYDGKKPTGREIKELLPGVLAKIGRIHGSRGEEILGAWPSIIGERLAGMTKAISFIEGVLTVKVNNSSLYSLLSQHERPKILLRLKERFPHTNIKNILFRMVG
jgi:hypothetical protein